MFFYFLSFFKQIFFVFRHAAFGAIRSLPPPLSPSLPLPTQEKILSKIVLRNPNHGGEPNSTSHSRFKQVLFLDLIWFCSSFSFSFALLGCETVGCCGKKLGLLKEIQTPMNRSCVGISLFLFFFFGCVELFSKYDDLTAFLEFHYILYDELFDRKKN